MKALLFVGMGKNPGLIFLSLWFSWETRIYWVRDYLNTIM